MTLQDLQSSLINSINENYITQAKTTETISFDKYADLINTSMKKYQLHVEIPKDIDSDTEEEEKIVEQAKNLYDALSQSTLKECKVELNDNCIHCPFYIDVYGMESCVIKELSCNLSVLIKGVKENV